MSSFQKSLIIHPGGIISIIYQTSKALNEYYPPERAYYPRSRWIVSQKSGSCKDTTTSQYASDFSNLTNICTVISSRSTLKILTHTFKWSKENYQTTVTITIFFFFLVFTWIVGRNTDKSSFLFFICPGKNHDKVTFLTRYPGLSEKSTNLQTNVVIPSTCIR